MAILIIFFIIIVTLTVLYKKGVFTKKGESLSEVSVYNQSPDSPSLLKDDLQVAVKFFDARGVVLVAEDDAKKFNINKFSDEVQDYINEMISLFNRRGQKYSVEFVNMNFLFLVVFKYWD